MSTVIHRQTEASYLGDKEVTQKIPQVKDQLVSLSSLFVWCVK